MDTPPPLSAKYVESFAYTTITSRLPVILTKVIDTVYRSKSADSLDQEAASELKAIVNKLSKLRNEVQTGKPVTNLEEDGRGDVCVWNDYLKQQIQDNNEAASWFRSAWLYVECYMYRRIQAAVLTTIHWRELDVFKAQKDEGLRESSAAVSTLLQHLHDVTTSSSNSQQLHQLFIQFLQVQLWGNKCDLSISAGVENHQTTSPLQQLHQMKDYILVDNMSAVWDTLTAAGADKPGSVRLDIVLDNAGFELITDLCMAEFLLASNLVKCIQFHGKSIPWFVSDVTRRDFDFTLDYLSEASSNVMSALGRKWRERISDGSFVYKDHDFWTLPHDFSEMKKVAPGLYQELSQSDLIIFKGDLNYRKLVADRQWAVTVPFEQALRGFHPAPLCSLRTLKADVVTGLAEGVLERVQACDKDWMTDGQWAVVQCCLKKVAL